MAGLHIQIEMKGFDKLADPALIAGARNVMVEAALEVVAAEAKSQAPGQGRKYISSFLDRSTGVGIVKAGFPLTFQITGTRPHAVAARRGGQGGRRAALRFTAGGETLFRASVSHPGVRANPFLAQAARAADAPAGHAADAALQKVLGPAAG